MSARITVTRNLSLYRAHYKRHSEALIDHAILKIASQIRHFHPFAGIPLSAVSDTADTCWQFKD